MNPRDHLAPAQPVRSNTKKLGHLLVFIENWECLMEQAGPGKQEAIFSRLSGLIHTHFGSDFRSLTLNSGEFFVIIHFEDEQPLLERSHQLKHALEMVRIGNQIPLEVSICMTSRYSDQEVYKVLLRMRRALEICKQNGQKILCVI